MDKEWSFDFDSSNPTQVPLSVELAPSESQFSICKNGPVYMAAMTITCKNVHVGSVTQ